MIYKKIIYILLTTIIILSTVLLLKIKSTPKYDEGLYSEIYTEYNELKDTTEEGTNDLMENTVTITKANNIKQSEKYNKIIAIIEIKKIGIFYPIASEMTMDNLKISPAKLYGGSPNEVGNFCIIGHNLRSSDQFSKLNKLENDDIVKITSINGQSLNYKVYDKEIVDPNNLNCLSQETNGKKEVTLITCTSNSKQRLVIKCIEE